MSCCCRIIIIGLPSFGSIGQSAIDLIISTIRAKDPNLLKFVGVGETELLLPLAGYEKYHNSIHLSHPVEFYRLTNTRVVFVLIRSICLENEEEHFADELIQFLKNYGYGSAILLTGASPDEWDVAFMNKKTQFFSFSENSTFAEFPTKSSELFEKTWQMSLKKTNEINHSNQPFPFGAELAAAIYSKNSDRIVVLGKFSVGGMDLQRESLFLPHFILGTLQFLGQNSVEITDLRPPQSWIEMNKAKEEIFPIW